MKHHSSLRSRLRCLLVWWLVSGAVGALAILALPAVRTAAAGVGAGKAGFAELLVGGCAGAAMVAGGVLWLVTTEVVVGVLGVRRGGLPGLARGGRGPGPLRALVLAACGVVALGTPALAAPAAAPVPVLAAERESDGDLQSWPSGPARLDGLPLPDRPSDRGPAIPDGDRAPDDRVRVLPGDSLWLIAERRLGARASVVAITEYWHRIYASNARVIGPDPDLIHPGQVLDLPRVEEDP